MSGGDTGQKEGAKFGLTKLFIYFDQGVALLHISLVLKKSLFVNII